MFNVVKPEDVGVFSSDVLDFLKTLDEYNFATHSVIMAKGNKIFTECYYKPFNKDFNHRMYSVSKSFVSIAIGLAYTEGLLSLDDIILDYFPEYKKYVKDQLFYKTTIKDMLTMRSNVASYVNWWGIFDDRIASYYTNKSSKIPNTLFYYDSVGSSVLGCIIEKLTGKDFLEYLKEKILLQLGFSKESYVMKAAGGYAFSDSGVVCTSRDLLIFARFVMNLGRVNGKQYIDAEFMRQAISKQVDNDVDGAFAPYKKYGYGYLIWKAHDDGFAFLGMGDQLAICDVKNDFIFVMTADNQSDTTTSRAIIFHELYKRIIENIHKEPISLDGDDYDRLVRYIDDLELVKQVGERKSPAAEQINGKKYNLGSNPMGIDNICIELDEDVGKFIFEKGEKQRCLEFGLCKNVIGKFPEDEINSNTAGITEKGQYDCASSAAWTEPNKLVIKSQIIDTYFGCLNIYIYFLDNEITLLMKKSGQYVLDGYEGYAIGEAEV